MELDRAPLALAAPISGETAEDAEQLIPTQNLRPAHKNMNPIGSVPMSSCGFASWSMRNPILRPTCAACRLRISTNGWNTATPLPARRLSPINEPLQDDESRYTSNSGASARTCG